MSLQTLSLTDFMFIIKTPYNTHVTSTHRFIFFDMVNLLTVDKSAFHHLNQYFYTNKNTSVKILAALLKLKLLMEIF